MNKECLGFINIYKFIASIIIACFLHYRVLLLGLFQEAYIGNNELICFLMAESSNYIVELFFMMSGLIFAFAYQESITKQKISFASFFDKRLEKLIPLTLITTVIMFPIRIILERNIGGGFYPGGASIDELINSLILANSTLCKVRINPSGWYIAKLFICYLIAFFLAKNYKRIGKITFFLPIILGLIIREVGFDFPLIEFHASRAYISFFGGIILAKKLELIRKNKYIILFVMVVSLFTPMLFYEYISDWSLVATVVIFPGIIVVGYCLPILNIIGNTIQGRFLSKISFDIYLWNCPILAVIAILHHKFMFTINTSRFIFILIVLHIAIGTISHSILEIISKKIF